VSGVARDDVAAGRQAQRRGLPSVTMRIAALYDIHGNLPALEAVLEDVRKEGVDQVMVGGDVVPGPMPRESLQRLLDLDLPVRFIHGNGERSVLAQMGGIEGREVTYWGTVSGRALPEPDRANMRWSAEQLHPEYQPVLARWPMTLRFPIEGLGDVLFCHGTPRSETEVITRLTAEGRLLPLFDPLGAAVVVCGHTHMQFDRMVGSTRVVNAGSVGSPHGEPGAFWLVLGRDVQLRRTQYDLERAAAQIESTGYPQAREFAEGILRPPAEAGILALFGEWELRLPGEMREEDNGFSYRARKSGDVEITRHGGAVTTLRGRAARDFLAAIESCTPAEAQQRMARVTGNYKRGNERTAGNHPRNRR
jgi:predicted phosphodiesterase